MAVMLIFSFLFSQETAQWRGEKRDGKYTETDLLKKWPENGPKLLWHFDELGPGHASAAVTKDIIYTAGTIEGDGYVFAFDNNGKLLWKKKFGKEWMDSWDGVRATPLIHGNKLYIMSSYCILVCMNAKSGADIWKVNLIEKYGARNIKWGVTENLLIDGDKLFCIAGGAEANVIALNKNTGNLIWKCKGMGDKSAYHSPGIYQMSGRKLLITHTEKNILGIDAENGKLLWNQEFPNQYFVHPNTPLFDDGYLYCFSGYGKGGIMLKLNADGSKAEKLWTETSLDNQMGGAILYNDRIYGAGQKSRKWICLDKKTGKVLGESKMFKVGNIIFADGMLYCYGQGGTVGLIEPKSNGFNLISSFKVPYGEKQHWAHLVINNKRLFVRHGTSLMVYSIAE